MECPPNIDPALSIQLIHFIIAKPLLPSTVDKHIEASAGAVKDKNSAELYNPFDYS